MDRSRRKFLQAGSIGLLSFKIGGASLLLTPREARARGADLEIFGADEAAQLSALGEIIVPGAREAGLVHFVDHQLSVPPADSLLMIRYLDIPPPYTEIYRPGLRAANAASESMFDKAIDALSPDEAEAFVTAMSSGAIESWQGPPAPLFYFIVRSDAVDVVYGTPEGFEKLGIPYMPHIYPETNW